MTEADRKQAQADRLRRAALRSSVIQELRQQYSDAPEEIRDRQDFQSERESREEMHRYLENNFSGSDGLRLLFGVFCTGRNSKWAVKFFCFWYSVMSLLKCID